MRILLAIDVSEASEAAASYVAECPWPPGATVEVLTVAEHQFLRHPLEFDAETKRRADELTAGVAERLRSAGICAVPIVLFGDPRAVIPERAREMNADLVVVGPHGNAGPARFPLGSVANAVVRLAPCSVAVVRASKRTVGPSRKVLLATDGSACSLRAAQAVAARPWPAGSEVRILSVVELTVPMLQPPYSQRAGEAQRSEAMQHAQDAIRAAEQLVSAAGIPVSESLSVLLEDPGEIILAEAANWGADWIVLGYHGRRGIDRFLLGSVSEAVAQHATCSVEVVR